MSNLSNYEDFVYHQFQGLEPLENKNLRDRFIYTVGLAGETGEVLEILKKQERDGKFDKEKLKLELGDVLFYLTCIALSEGLTHNEIMLSNREKLIKRNKIGKENE